MLLQELRHSSINLKAIRILVPKKRWEKCLVIWQISRSQRITCLCSSNSRLREASDNHSRYFNNSNKWTFVHLISRDQVKWMVQVTLSTILLKCCQIKVALSNRCHSSTLLIKRITWKTIQIPQTSPRLRLLEQPMRRCRLSRTKLWVRWVMHLKDKTHTQTKGRACQTQCTIQTRTPPSTNLQWCQGSSKTWWKASILLGAWAKVTQEPVPTPCRDLLSSIKKPSAWTCQEDKERASIQF